MAVVANTSKERLLRAAIDHVSDHGVADLSLRRARRRDRHEPPDAHLPLRLQGGPAHRGDPGGGSATTRHAGRARRRPGPLPRRRRAAHVAAPLRSRALAERAIVLRDLRAGTASPPPHRRVPRRHRRVVARADRGVARCAGRAARPQPACRRASISRSTRGLLLDLLATGDRAGTTDAVEQAIALFETWRAQLPSVRGTPGDDDVAAPTATGRARLLLVSGSLRAIHQHRSAQDRAGGGTARHRDGAL